LAGIVFYFEDYDKDVYSGRRIDLDAWNYAMKSGGIDKAICFNCVHDIKLQMDNKIHFTEIHAHNVKPRVILSQWLNENGIDKKIVLFTPPKSAPNDAIHIKDLEHNTVDWYVFGPSVGVDSDYKNTQYVYIPTADERIDLHSVHIGSYVMLRRFESLENADIG
jgi:hypothetical protein